MSKTMGFPSVFLPSITSVFAKPQTISARLAANAANSKLTRKELSERGRAMAERKKQLMTPEEYAAHMTANGKAGSAAKWANTTPEQRSEIIKKTWETRRKHFTAEQISAMQARDPEKIRERMLATTTPEQRSQQAKKASDAAAVVRSAKAAAKRHGAAA